MSPCLPGPLRPARPWRVQSSMLVQTINSDIVRTSVASAVLSTTTIAFAFAQSASEVVGDAASTSSCFLFLLASAVLTVLAESVGVSILDLRWAQDACRVDLTSGCMVFRDKCGYSECSACTLSMCVCGSHHVLLVQCLVAATASGAQTASAGMQRIHKA